MCHPNGKIKYFIPLLPNFKGETPLHICVRDNILKSLDLLLEGLKLYPADHHSRMI